jgi:hypothetical protein
MERNPRLRRLGYWTQSNLERAESPAEKGKWPVNDEEVQHDPQSVTPVRHVIPAHLVPVKEAFRQLIRDIDAGRVMLRKLCHGACWTVDFETDNGWRICVFNDAGYFDDIESAVDRHGNSLTWDDLYDDSPIEHPKTFDQWGIRHFLHGDDPDMPPLRKPLIPVEIAARLTGSPCTLLWASKWMRMRTGEVGAHARR